LSLGGSFTASGSAQPGRREFCAPYVYSAFPTTLPPWIGGENLPWAVIREQTPVYERQDVSSRVIGRIGPAIVEFISAVEPGLIKPGDHGWVTRTGTLLARLATPSRVTSAFRPEHEVGLFAARTRRSALHLTQTLH
jgi:hypothetical protein